MQEAGPCFVGNTTWCDGWCTKLENLCFMESSSCYSAQSYTLSIRASSLMLPNFLIFQKKLEIWTFYMNMKFTHFHQFSTSYDVMVAFSRDSDLLYLTHWFLFLLLSSLEMNFLDIPYGCAFSLSSEPANHFAHSLLLFLPMMSCTTFIYIYSVPPTRQ